MHPRKPSPSAKKRSPTSASRPSICSTRNTPEAAWRSPGVVVAGAAAAEVAAGAGVADAAAAAADGAAAVRPGAPAVGAEQDRSLDLQICIHRHRHRTSWPGSTTSTRPFHVLSAVPLARNCRADLRRHSTMPADAFDGQIPFHIPLAGKSVLRQRAAVTGKMRVSIS